MTEILKKAIIDIETNTVKEVALTEEEIIAHNEMLAEQAQMISDAEAAKTAREELVASARAKLISGTPLTDAEAAVLVV